MENKEQCKRYTIGEVAEKTDLSTHTLRYYEKEKILNAVHRKENGLREYTDNDIELLKVITCLKDTGMSISKIRDYVQLCNDGNHTIEERRDIFVKQKQHIEEELTKLTKHLETANYKIWYYDNLEKVENEMKSQNGHLDCDTMKDLYNKRFI